MGHIQLDKVIGLLIKEIVSLRIEAKVQRSLLSGFAEHASPDFLKVLKELDAVFESKLPELFDTELQSLLDRFDVESDEMTDFLKSLFD